MLSEPRIGLGISLGIGGAAALWLIAIIAGRIIASGDRRTHEAAMEMLKG